MKKIILLAIPALLLAACGGSEKENTETTVETTNESTTKAPNLPAPNPWLTKSVYPTSHHNPGQTDASPVAGPTEAKELTIDDVKTVKGLFNSQPVTKHIGEDRILIVAGVLGIRKIYATGDAFDEVSFLPYPGIEDLASKTTEE